jgi:hypothetical protein
MFDTQLRQAHDLIERGRTAEARRLLQTLDDPTARLWLAQLDARKRPAKRRNPIPLPLLIAVAVVLGVGALIVILLLTPTLLSRLQNGSVEAQASTAAAEETLNADLNHFCTMRTGINSDSCLDWMDAVLRAYHPAAVSCLSASGVETQEQRAAFGQCLASAGVPPPV